MNPFGFATMSQPRSKFGLPLRQCRTHALKGEYKKLGLDKISSEYRVADRWFLKTNPNHSANNKTDISVETGYVMEINPIPRKNDPHSPYVDSHQAKSNPHKVNVDRHQAKSSQNVGYVCGYSQYVSLLIAV